MHWWRSRAGQRVGDLLLAIGTAVLAWTDLRSQDAHVPGPRAVTGLVFTAMAGCLLARRARPVGALAVALGLFTALNIAYTSSETLGGLLALLLLAYAAGAYGRRPQAWWALLGLVGGFVVHDAVDTTLTGFADYAAASVFDLAGVGAWFAGAFVRTRRELVLELRGRADRAALEERNRIAREIHDVVAHGVTVMVLQAEAAEEVLTTDPQAASLALRRVQDVGRSSLLELRRALGALRPDSEAGLAPQPGCRDLPELVQRSRDLGLDVSFAWTGPELEDEATSVGVYRIVQESLTNVARHARAAAAEVRVDVGESVVVQVRDDGAGEHSTSAGHGTGLIGMRARAEALGGRFRAGPVLPRGFLVEAVIPRTTA